MPTRVPQDFEETIKRLTLDLKEVERYLVFADIPRGTLEALSEAVDKIRATGWAVLNSTIDQFSAGSQGTIVLTSHRVQRAIALLSGLEGEIDTGRITPATKGADELLTRLGVAYKKLHYFLTGRRVPVQTDSG